MENKKNPQKFSEEEKQKAHYKQGGQCIGCWAMFPFEEMEVDDSCESHPPIMVCQKCNKDKNGSWKSKSFSMPDLG